MQSTLSLRLEDYEAEYGSYMGWGQGPAKGDLDWDADQLRLINTDVKSGVRRFYHPPILPGEATSYSWSFLKPISEVTITSGSRTVDLPDDFGDFEGSLGISSTAGLIPYLIRLTGVALLYRQYEGIQGATGQPQYAAVEPIRGTTPIRGQRWRLVVWPEPDADYVIRGQYTINPDALTGDRPYVYGGAQHHETVLESVLAVAEQRRDNVAEGPHKMAFLERLAASISMDRRLQPEFLGRNRDRSDWMWGDDRRHRRDYGHVVTVNGAVPS